MNRGRRIAFVCGLGFVGALIAHLTDPSGRAYTLTLLATGLVLGELLALRLEDRGAVPLSYAVLVVLASTFQLREYAIAVAGAEVVSILLRVTDRQRGRPAVLFGVRIAVAAATYGAYQGAWHLVGRREAMAPVLVALGAAAAAQLAVDVTASKVFRLGESFSARGRLAWLAIASSGMLMAIGYRGVDGMGRVGILGPLLFSTPLLAAWYAFERLDAATRSYRQTIEALAMAPGARGDGAARSRRASCHARLGDGRAAAGCPRRRCAISRWRRCCTISDRSRSTNPPTAGVSTLERSPRSPVPCSARSAHSSPRERSSPVRSTTRSAASRCKRCRLASEYDDLTVRDNVPGNLAVESLRSAPAYVYDERVVVALERVLRDRVSANS